MFLLCNPHNPTGQVYSPEELSRMAEICLKHNTIIVSDEIHSELLLGDVRHTPIATLSPEIAEHSITLVAPSKTFNTAGLFCGFAILPNAELRERYKEQVERMTLHVSSLAQAAALVAFSGECDDWLEELRAYLIANRDFLVEFVQKELPGIRITRPDATYLAWLDCTELVSSGQIKGSPFDFFLKKAKVALNDGVPFGTGGEGFVRLNFGCSRATLEEALQRMKTALNS
jgi:cystathionine beta-lyase